jgi:hypothetical protein
MSDKLIEELEAENLCTHFILPLLKLNKFSFGGSNFTNSFIASSDHVKDHLFITENYIVVQVIEIAYLSRRIMLLDEYDGTYTDGSNHSYLVYRVPLRWVKDLWKFKEGKFSEMSEDAKLKIIQWSGLSYRYLDHKSGQVVTDVRIMALNKEKPLKKWWENRIVPLDPIEGELLSIPNGKSYINLDSLIKTEPGH